MPEVSVSNPTERRKRGGRRPTPAEIYGAVKETRKEERRKMTLNALRAGNTRHDSYTYAGVSPTVFHRWMNEDPEWHDAVIQAEAACKVTHVTNLARAAQNGSWQASLAFLERRYPREWGKIAQLDIAFKGMSREQLQAYVAQRLQLPIGPGVGDPGESVESGGEVIEGEGYAEE